MFPHLHHSVPALEVDLWLVDIISILCCMLWFKFWVKTKYWVIQENLIEFLLQDNSTIIQFGLGSCALVLTLCYRLLRHPKYLFSTYVLETVYTWVLWYTWTLTFFLIFFLFLLLFDDEEACDCSHMTCHMMWGHRPRLWKKRLEVL